jgi:hypothetical protein
LQKITTNSKLDNEEEILFQLGTCLVESIPNYNFFNPNKAYTEFKSISIVNSESINKFLLKYDLSIESIKDSILNGVYIESKSINTVSAYENALTICNTCRYKDELSKLICNRAFDDSKRIMSESSLNHFIQNYNGCDLVPKAIDLRDSIVFKGLKKTYSNYLVFTKNYPNSKLTSKIIQELPDILYQEAIDSNTFESLTRFVTIFPNDSRVKAVIQKIKYISFSEISINKTNNWDLECSLNLSKKDSDNGFALVYTSKEKPRLMGEEITHELRYYGYINKHGKEIIPIGKDDIFEYIDDVPRFSEGIVRVKSEGKWGFIDGHGNKITEFKYEEASDFKNGFAAVGLNGKVGFIDNTGKERIPLIYDDATIFINGLSCVELNGKEGFIDTNGKQVTPLKYDWIWESYFENNGSDYNGLIKVGLNGKSGFIDNTGKEITPIKYDRTYDRASDFMEGVVRVGIRNGDNFKFGFINKEGKEITPIKYDGASNFKDGFALLRLNGKYGIIDITGKEIILKYNDISISHCNEGIAKVKQNGKFGYINKEGKEITSIKYDHASDFMEGVARVGIRNGDNFKFGYINKEGKEITALKYDDGFCYNCEGNYAEEFKFKDNYGLIKVRLNGKYGFIDNTGKERIPLIYDYVFPFFNGLSRVLQNEKCGYINKEGKEITPIKYDAIPYGENIFFYDDIIQVGLNGKCVCINKEGKEITPIKYDGVSDFEDGFAIVSVNEKYGIINKEGKEITPIKYDQLFFNVGNYFFAKDGCEWKIVIVHNNISK